VKRPPWLARPVFSTFLKVLVAFLLVLIPLYTISLALFARGAEALRKEVYASMQSKVAFSSRLLNSELGRVLRQQRSIANDLNIVFLSVAADSMSSYERFVAVRTLEDRLHDMKESSNEVSDVVAYIPLLGYRISADHHLTSIQPQEYEAMRTHAAEQSLFGWQDSLYSSAAYPTPLSGISDSVLVVAVKYSQPELTSLLAQLKVQLTEDGGGGIGRAAVFDPGLRWLVGDLGEQEVREALLGLALPEGMEELVGTSRVSIGGSSFVAGYARNRLLGTFLLSLVPERLVLEPLRIYSSWILMQVAGALIIVALFSLWLYRLVHRPLRRLVLSFQRLERGDFDHSLEYRSHDEFGYLYRQFNQMTARLGELVRVVYEQKYRLSVSELRQLQSQIRPHFLSNCFFTLYRMAKLESSERITRFSKLLGDYFRYISRTDCDETDLASELEHSRTYIEIQKVRFEDRIQVTFPELPPGCRELRVPRLIMQPVIENAYHHGLEDRLEGGRLTIGFRQEGSRLLVVIEDNGKGLTDGQLAELRSRLEGADQGADGIGLSNVHRRLRIKFGAASGLALSHGAHGGLRVEMNIPVPEAT
jgi:two-component system sensor histidine kinase YesM